MSVIFSAPEPLTAHHTLTDVQSGEAVLDEWLLRRAFKNQALGASRTYVISAEAHVVGYYALANGSAIAAEARGRLPFQ